MKKNIYTIFEFFLLFFVIFFSLLFIHNFVFSFLPSTGIPIDPNIENGNSGGKPTIADLWAIVEKIFEYGAFFGTAIGISILSGCAKFFLSRFGFFNFINDMTGFFKKNGFSSGAILEEINGTPADIFEAVNQTTGGNFLKPEHFSFLGSSFFSFVKTLANTSFSLEEDITGVPTDLKEILESYQGSRILTSFSAATLFFAQKFYQIFPLPIFSVSVNSNQFIPLEPPTIDVSVTTENSIKKIIENFLDPFLVNDSKALNVVLFLGVIVAQIYLPVYLPYFMKFCFGSIVCSVSNSQELDLSNLEADLFSQDFSLETGNSLPELEY